MRDIKFRAWCEGTHGGLTFMNPTMEYDVIIQDGKYADVENGWDIHGTYETIPLMQYTGLKDKNGVVIYDGDVFWSDHSGEYTYVEYQEGAFYIIHTVTSEKTLLSKEHGDWIIRGNIYENPELLEREPQ